MTQTIFNHLHCFYTAIRGLSALANKLVPRHPTFYACHSEGAISKW